MGRAMATELEVEDNPSLRSSRHSPLQSLNGLIQPFRLLIRRNLMTVTMKTTVAADLLLVLLRLLSRAS